MNPPIEELNEEGENIQENGMNIFDAMSLANIIEKAWERHSSGEEG